MTAFPLLTLLFLLAVPNAWGREKSDLLILANGNQITGEVKKLQRGLLTVKTDSMGTVSVEWDEVQSFVSRYEFELELRDGTLLDGSLETAEAPRQIRLVGKEGTAELAMANVVGLMEIDERFLRRFDGSFSLGSSYGKSSEVFQLNYDGELKYRRPTYILSLDADGTLTKQPDLPTTQREDYALASRKFLGNNWFTGTSLEGQRNDELDLNFRILVQGTGGRALYQTNYANFTVQAGLAYNREWVVDAPASDSIEAPVAIEYSIFLYNTPKTNFTLSISTYPSVTNAGRVRAEFDASLKQEFVKDFFVELNPYDSFDSEPQTPGATKNDYGFVMSIGYSFG